MPLPTGWLPCCELPTVRPLNNWWGWTVSGSGPIGPGVWVIHRALGIGLVVDLLDGEAHVISPDKIEWLAEPAYLKVIDQAAARDVWQAQCAYLESLGRKPLGDIFDELTRAAVRHDV